MNKLTPRQQQFVLEMLAEPNCSATAAAIKAGYAERSAKRIAYELVNRPDVKAAIEEARQERMERTKVTADQVVRELQRLAMFDPADLIHVRRPADIAKLPEDVRRAIVGWKKTAHGFEVKLAKETALELLGRHHGLFRDKLELGGDVNVTVQNLTGSEALKPWRKPGA